MEDKPEDGGIQAVNRAVGVFSGLLPEDVRGTAKPDDSALAHGLRWEWLHRAPAQHWLYDPRRARWFRYLQGRGWHEHDPVPSIEGFLATVAEVRVTWSRIKAIESLLQRHQTPPELRVRDGDDIWDRDPLAVGLPRGRVWDFTAGPWGAEREQTSEDYVRAALLVAPNGHAGPLMGRWDDLVLQWCGDDEGLCDYLKMVAGYWLVGGNRDQVFFVFRGPTGSGKTTFLDILDTLLGAYASTIQRGTFTHSREDHPAAVAALAGRRVLFGHEFERGVRFKADLLKSWSGGEKQAARWMRGNPFVFRPAGPLVFACNDLPTLPAADAALRRRMRIIPFEYQPQKPDELLKAHVLSAWMPGVARWCLEGAAEYLQAGLVEPPAVARETDRYMTSQDWLSRFLEAETQPSSGFVERGSLVERAERHALKTRRSAPSARDVAEAVRRLPHVRDLKTGGTRVWTGIEWRN